MSVVLPDPGSPSAKILNPGLKISVPSSNARKARGWPITSVKRGSSSVVLNPKDFGSHTFRKASFFNPRESSGDGEAFFLGVLFRFFVIYITLVI
jgi:hypothetical protein